MFSSPNHTLYFPFSEKIDNETNKIYEEEEQARIVMGLQRNENIKLTEK